ncbi:hypothetical protein DL769_010206 [Monosporascus sp. CRB-8-3]|nr:hypothetical protein DL769_010206 [Monosporascus sp. CRB-8-3]
MVISDLILDLIILLLPLPSIWNLSMAAGRKIAITGIFLLGMMSVVASIVRLAIYLTVLYKGYGAGYDINRTATTMLWWSMLEGALAAMAACLPTLSFLFKDVSVWQLFSRLRSISGLSSSWRLSGNDSNSREKIRHSLGGHSDTIGSVDPNGTHEQIVINPSK